MAVLFFIWCVAFFTEVLVCWIVLFDMVYFVSFWLIYFGFVTQLNLHCLYVYLVRLWEFHCDFHSHGRNQWSDGQYRWDASWWKVSRYLTNGTLTFNCVTMVLRWIPGGTRKKCYREINIGGLCLVIGTTLDLDVSLRCPFSVCPMIYEDFRSPITFHSLTFSSIYPCIYE